MMKNPKIKSIAVVVFLATQLGLSAKKVKLHHCPESVRSVILQNMQGGELDDVKLKVKRGEHYYVAEVDFPRGREIEIYVSLQGTLLKTLEEIHLHEAPRAVRTKLVNMGGKVDDVEIERSSGKVTYHAEIDRKGAPDLEVILSPAGKILSKQIEIDD